jgi:CRP/FNR family nitrogen fixation transcriptional regulator
MIACLAQVRQLHRLTTTRGQKGMSPQSPSPTLATPDKTQGFAPETREYEAFVANMYSAGVVMSYPRDTQIFREKEPATYLYKVISGGIRSCKMFRDGRRQISAFHLPGDIFGLEPGDEHMCTAEAVTDTKVLVISRKMYTAMAERDAAAARKLLDLTARELRRVQERLILLVQSAQERVATFLLEMAERSLDGDIIELPMSRQDVADYLGLTTGTVSRTFTLLESCGTIEVSARRVLLRDRSGLNRLRLNKNGMSRTDAYCP